MGTSKRYSEEVRERAVRMVAVRDGELHEIKSPLILQPGPAALTDGLDAIHEVVRQWSERQAAGALRRVGE
jgi:transposase-like protein